MTDKTDGKTARQVNQSQVYDQNDRATLPDIEQKTVELRSVYRRTYLQADWDDPIKRMQYIDEAREAAWGSRPAEVDIYITEKAGRKGIRVVRIIAHTRR